MAPPIYFFPRVPLATFAPLGRPDQQLLARYRLVETFDGVTNLRKQCAVFDFTGVGPGKASGVMVSILARSRKAPDRFGYFPDRQRWHRFGDGETEIHVGIDNDSPPVPEDLERENFLRGYQYDLEGHRWQVPVARDPDGGSWLPSDWLYGEDDRIRSVIRDEYKQLWDDAGELVDLFFSGAPTISLDPTVATDWCLRALGINYRVNRYLQNILRLVNSRNWNDILALVIDVPGFFDVFQRVQEEKKREPPAPQTTGPDAPTSDHQEDGPARTDISPGSEDSSRDTDPAGENSTPPGTDSDETLPPPRTTSAVT